MTILVSAGHGPRDPGAIHFDFIERDEAALWRDAIVDRGGALFRAVPPLTLQGKVGYINAQCAYDSCIAVELHFNSGGTPGQTRGCEVLYAPGSTRGVVLADIVLEALAPLFGSRGVKEAWYRQDHPHRVDYAGDAEGDEVVDYFCRATRCPAIIIEPDFVYEAARIQRQRATACEALAAALIEAHRLLT